MEHLPHWLTNKRISRRTYWLLGVGSSLCLVVLGTLAFSINRNLGVFVTVILALLYWVINLVLGVWRSNDISPDAKANMTRRGLATLFSGWMLDFMPSNPKSGSSFNETGSVMQEGASSQHRFLRLGGKNVFTALVVLFLSGLLIYFVLTVMR
jgi:uncharacterized membrane protein YfcA